MIHWGLCCLFRHEPICFRRASATALGKFPRREQLRRLGELALHNAESLTAAFDACCQLGIDAFRISSELLPLATHPAVGYRVEELPGASEILAAFAAARLRAAAAGLRLSLHPDQFVVLNSPAREIAAAARSELEHQSHLAELCGAGEINLHAGGVYGDKTAALARLRAMVDSLSPTVRSRLTLENDDRSYTVEDLLPCCFELHLPLVYDVHHHRVHPDNLTIEEASSLAADTWRFHRSPPHFHLSSPALPWASPGNHRPHADYIEPADLPDCWRSMELTVDVEAKAGEMAVVRLIRLQSENALSFAAAAGAWPVNGDRS